MANKKVTVKALPENGSTSWQLGKATFAPGEQEVTPEQAEALQQAGLLEGAASSPSSSGSSGSSEKQK